MTDPAAINEDVLAKLKRLDGFYAEVERVLVGQRLLIDQFLIGLLAGGRLSRRRSGVGKDAGGAGVFLARCISFSRMQFTPDLLPADVLGTQIFNPRTGKFSIKKGPVFADLMLRDEINRTRPRSRGATLEAMQEQQVTLGTVVTNSNSVPSARPRRIRSSRKELTRFPKRNSTDLCSRSRSHTRTRPTS